jgi:hypothetical protein
VQNHASGAGSRSVACNGARGVEDHLPREGTFDRESIARVTAGYVETILAALTARASAGNGSSANTVRDATGVSEWVALVFEARWVLANRGLIRPRKPGGPRSDSGVVKTLDSSVRTAQSVRHAQGESPDDEPGAGEYGCSLNRVLGSRNRSNASRSRTAASRKTNHRGVT